MPKRSSCSVEGCPRATRSGSHALCEMHYMRWYRTGSTDPRSRLTDEERFWSKVVKSDGCWRWLGAPQPDGYALIKIAHQMRPAHKVAYEYTIGAVPDGLQLDHLCRNRGCVNPAHLEPVTARENTMRSPIALGALNARKTHCPQGHPYDESNTVVTSSRRTCRICNAEKQRRYRARQCLP